MPCYNEQEVIRESHAQLSAVLRAMGHPYEIIFIDDGSRDGTASILREIAAADSNVRVLLLSRNFGHQAALTAGLTESRGDAVVVIDADLQDPPEVIPEMLRLWREGNDVIFGQRTQREGETAFKLQTAKLFYRMMEVLSDTPIPRDTGDFRLMDRKVVEAFLSLGESDRFVRGMVSWLGYRQVALPYSRKARAAGETKYPLRKMLRFALDAVLSFSLFPLRVVTGLGLIAAGLSMLGILYALVLRLFTNIWVSGWTLLFIAVMFMGGVQLLCLGVMGEYVGRIYRQVKMRPVFLVRERIGPARER